MSDQEQYGAVVAEARNGGRRLNSWKEIASHLQRDVRTVQRWHQRAGLPVHRHADPLQRGVFAFEEELSAWANQVRRDSTGEPQPALSAVTSGAEERPRRFQRFLVVAACVLVLAGAFAVAALWMRGTPSVAFHERDWLLIGAIDNRTGDDQLENTVQYALEQQIKASSFVNVVPLERVQDTMRLMRQPENAVLTPELAREVAVRDGGIRAILTGRVERVGGGYLLSLQMVDPQTGAALRAWTDKAPIQADMLEGVKRLSLSVRRALGESESLSHPDARLPRVTTGSLNALRLYGQAEQALAGHHSRAAVKLLEAALRDDPEFASAHVRLADAMSQDPDVRPFDPRITDHLERAFALSNRVMEEERLRILMRYHYLRSEGDKAAAVCEALVRLRPDDWEVHHNLGVSYGIQQRTRESIAEMERAAALRPNDFRRAVWAARALAAPGGDLDRARPYVDRARLLWPAQAAEYSAERMGIMPAPYSRDAAWALLFPAYDRWRAHDLPGMLAEVRRVLDSEPLVKGSERDGFLTIAVGMSMTTGRLHEARDLAQRMFGDQLREVQLAVVADAVDDFDAVRRHLSRFPTQNDGRALRYVRAGLYKQAAEILAIPGLRGGPNAETALAELALRSGRRTEAMDRLSKAIALARRNRLSERYLAAELLATELQRSHRPDEAIKVLEEAAADEPVYTATGMSGAYWLRVLGRLIREYRALGRDEDAEAKERQLRGLLALADADHPLVLQLAHSPTSLPTR